MRIILIVAAVAVLVGIAYLVRKASRPSPQEKAPPEDDPGKRRDE